MTGTSERNLTPSRVKKSFWKCPSLIRIRRHTRTRSTFSGGAFPNQSLQNDNSKFHSLSYKEEILWEWDDGTRNSSRQRGWDHRNHFLATEICLLSKILFYLKHFISNKQNSSQRSLSQEDSSVFNFVKSRENRTQFNVRDWTFPREKVNSTSQ